jgi:hypothetical protein
MSFFLFFLMHSSVWRVAANDSNPHMQSLSPPDFELYNLTATYSASAKKYNSGLALQL